MFTNLLVVPPRYIGSDATKSESWVTAGVGFVLSTSFWMAIGGGISEAIGVVSLSGRTSPSACKNGKVLDYRRP
jgi:hypothetical protein